MMSVADKPHLPDHILSEQTQLSFPSYPHWIEAAVEFLRQKAVLGGACDEARSGKLMVALHEALSNAVVHGNLEVSSELKEQGDNAFAVALAQRVADSAYSGRSVDILIDSNQERCTWVITDKGPGFDIDAVMKKKLSDDPEVILASGRGILIMSSFLDEMKYEMGGRRLILSLRRDSGEEKRSAPRLPIQAPIRIAPIRPDGAVDWDAAYEAVAKDLSEHGIALLQNRLATSGRILIGMSVDEQMIYLPAEVRHCRSLSGDLVEIGCRFQTKRASGIRDDEPVSDFQAIEKVMAEFLALHATPKLPADERRAHQRIVYTEQIEIVTPGHPEPLFGYARDLSRSGIAFITTVPLAAELTLIVLPRAMPGPLRLRATIVRCAKIQDGFFDVGAKFLGVESEALPAGAATA